MSMNQFRGREEENKKDFGKKSPIEQQEISKKSIPENNDQESTNESIAHDAAKKYDDERSKHLH